MIEIHMDIEYFIVSSREKVRKFQPSIRLDAQRDKKQAKAKVHLNLKGNTYSHNK